jgi:phosphonatase-like hydrolase
LESPKRLWNISQSNRPRALPETKLALHAALVWHLINLQGGMLSMLQLVVFDIAGTTVHDPDGVNRCLCAALHAAGLPVTREAANAVMGIYKPEAIRMLIAAAGPTAKPLNDKIPAIYADFQARMLDFYAADPDVREIAGAAAVFRELRTAGMKVALDTGFSRQITNVLLQRLGWSEGTTIDATITSDEVPRGRPHPDMILALMQRFAIGDPQAVAKVGDTPSDLQEGTNAGCRLVVGVTEGTHTRQQLESYPHTHLIGTVAEFPSLLRSLSLL